MDFLSIFNPLRLLIQLWISLSFSSSFFFFCFFFFKFSHFSTQHICSLFLFIYFFLSLRHGCIRNSSWSILLSFHSNGTNQRIIEIASSKTMRWNSLHSLNSWSISLLWTSNAWVNGSTSRAWLATVLRKIMSS